MRIKIDKSIESMVPEEFKSFDDESEYKLTKVESNGGSSMVSVGESIKGPLEIINKGQKPCVRVFNSHALYRYIRTSPIVEILDSTSNIITFRTEGGAYTLERLPDEKEKE